MIEDLKQRLLNGWHPMRWVALGLGLFVGYEAVLYQDMVSGFLSLFFLYQAVTNRGCMVGVCQPNAVSTNNSEESGVKNEEYTTIEFTEVEN
ncbi:MAG TPA: hypothetical protein VJ964_17040 [Balneolaceae bacterium]|nr:hypothetical protein [Balneolaceae bacterium]